MKTIFLNNGKLEGAITEEMVLQDNVLTISPLRDSHIILYIADNSPDFSAQTISVNFNQPHATVQIFGYYRMRDSQSLMINTMMNHAVPHCESRQVWRGILADQSKIDFEGKIFVAKDAQKTSAHLSNKNLLLSDGAEIKTKPFLEIYADDVQCSHGATVGCLDEQALFYLRSRGVPENEARILLIDAFLQEVIGA